MARAYMQPEDRKAQFLDAAMKLAGKPGGIANVTCKNVTDAVGVTRPLIYRHFKTVGDLQACTLERAAAEKKPAILGSAIVAGWDVEQFKMTRETLRGAKAWAKDNAAAVPA